MDLHSFNLPKKKWNQMSSRQSELFPKKKTRQLTNSKHHMHLLPSTFSPEWLRTKALKWQSLNLKETKSQTHSHFWTLIATPLGLKRYLKNFPLRNLLCEYTLTLCLKRMRLIFQFRLSIIQVWNMLNQKLMRKVRIQLLSIMKLNYSQLPRMKKRKNSHFLEWSPINNASIE